MCSSFLEGRSHGSKSNKEQSEFCLFLDIESLTVTFQFHQTSHELTLKLNTLIFRYIMTSKTFFLGFYFFFFSLRKQKVGVYRPITYRVINNKSHTPLSSFNYNICLDGNLGRRIYYSDNRITIYKKRDEFGVRRWQLSIDLLRLPKKGHINKMETYLSLGQEKTPKILIYTIINWFKEGLIKKV